MKYELTSGRNFNRTVVVIDEVDIFACAYNENVKKIKFTDEIAPKGATVPGFSDSIILMLCMMRTVLLRISRAIASEKNVGQMLLSRIIRSAKTVMVS